MDNLSEVPPMMRLRMLGLDRGVGCEDDNCGQIMWSGKVRDQNLPTWHEGEIWSGRVQRVQRHAIFNHSSCPQVFQRLTLY